MGFTLTDDYLRVDVDDRSSLYLRVSGGVRQVVATRDEAKDALIQVCGQPHGLERKVTRSGSLASNKIKRIKETEGLLINHML